jgi:hypothetical protein
MAAEASPEKTLSWLCNAETRLEELEAAITTYVFEAHEQTLRDVAICDHEADTCWCNYNRALDNLLRVLRHNSRRKPLRIKPDGAARQD